MTKSFQTLDIDQPWITHQMAEIALTVINN